MRILRMKETERIKNLCETALFIAIVFLGVFIIKFPGPFGICTSEIP